MKLFHAAKFSSSRQVLQDKVKINENNCIRVKKIAFTDTTDDDDHFWYIEDWNQVMEEIEFGQYIESPVFEIEGYKWQMLVYPKGRDEEYKNSIAIYAYQVPGFTVGK